MILLHGFGLEPVCAENIILCKNLKCKNKSCTVGLLKMLQLMYDKNFCQAVLQKKNQFKLQTISITKAQFSKFQDKSVTL